MGKKVDKEGSRWTAGGMEQQDDAAQPWLWSPVTGKGSTRPHAHPRARHVDGKMPEEVRDSTCGAGCRRGCHQGVDWPCALRNM